MAIKTFKHKGLKNFFKSGNKAGIQIAHVKKIKLVLELLNAAIEVKDMNFQDLTFIH